MSEAGVSTFESAVVVRVEPGYLVAGLYLRLGGRLRFVARGTALGVAPEHDHAEALVQALGRIERVTGRRLVRSGTPILPETTDRRGVDVMLAVVRTAGRGLRWGLVTTGQPPAPAQLHQLAAVAGAPPTGVVALGTDEVRRPVQIAAAVSALFTRPLDVLLIMHEPSARFEEPQQNVIRMVAAALSVAPPTPVGGGPLCLIAADAPMADRCRELLGERTRTALIGPLLERGQEPALSALADALDPLLASLAGTLGGFDRLKSWLESPPLHTRTANRRAVRACGALVGSHSLRLFDAARPPDLVELRGAESFGLSPLIGGSVLSLVPDQPSALVPALQRANAPWTAASSAADAAAETQALRALLGPALDLAGGRSVEGVIVTGTPAEHALGPAWAALAALDATARPGVYGVWLDGAGTLSDAAVLAQANPAVADEVLAGALTRLGAIVSPSGGGAGNLRVEIQHPDGYHVALEVPEGEIEVFPLEPGVPARIGVRPSGRQDVGVGPGRALDATVIGGEIGLIVDHRGAAAAGPRTQETAARWLRALRPRPPVLVLGQRRPTRPVAVGAR